MILKFYRRDRGGGWTFIDHVDRVDTIWADEPEDPSEGHTVYTSHDMLVRWAKDYWGNQAFAGTDDNWAFVIWPVFRKGREGTGGDSDAYTIKQAHVFLSDGRCGLAFLGQDEAFLLSDAGHTVDRLR